MIDYDDLDTNIKNWLEEIVSSDPYGLNPKTLYKNIYSSSGDDKTLAKIFAVPIGLIRVIKELDEEVQIFIYF